MGTLTVLFTKRRWNIGSWVIRWAMPRSRFAFALSSHAIVVGPDKCYEATMLHGVREVSYEEAIVGQVIVKETRYEVSDAAAGIEWAKSQVCTYVPNPPAWLPKWARAVVATVQKLLHNNYDWRGAFGLSLAPGRDWAEEDCWFCYEFGAGVLRAAGRIVFANISHVGERELMAINP